MFKVILSRISSVHQLLRTDEVYGRALNLPTIGESFSMLAESLTEGHSVRVVETSPVKETRLHPEEGSLEFWTENSHYGLQVLDMVTKNSKAS